MRKDQNHGSFVGFHRSFLMTLFYHQVKPIKYKYSKNAEDSPPRKNVVLFMLLLLLFPLTLVLIKWFLENTIEWLTWQFVFFVLVSVASIT